MKNQFFKMVRNSIKYWYVPLIVGLLFTAVGIWVFATPLESYLTLSVLFSITFLVAGLSETFFAYSNRKEIDSWGWMLFSGILNILLGSILISNPNISMIILSFYIGFLILFRSIQSIAIAYDLRNYGILDWGNLAIIGVLGVIFSCILIWNPVFAGLTLIFWTGTALILAGAATVYLAFKLRKLGDFSKKISNRLKTRLEEVNKEIQEEIQEM
ncbi:MAG: HdeD family acid-resistance protein [Bacteroidota bacterium]